MTKKIDERIIREEMVKVQNLGTTKYVRINLVDPMHDDITLGVNWSSIDTASSEATQEFINDLQRATDLVKAFNSKYEGCEIDYSWIEEENKRLKENEEAGAKQMAEIWRKKTEKN